MNLIHVLSINHNINKYIYSFLIAIIYEYIYINISIHRNIKIELCEEAEIKRTRRTARKYGIPKTNLLTWVRIYREKGESGFKNPICEI